MDLSKQIVSPAQIQGVGRLHFLMEGAEKCMAMGFNQQQLSFHSNALYELIAWLEAQWEKNTAYSLV